MRTSSDTVKRKISKEIIKIFQINIGDRCNQVCSHCHIGASPRGRKNMDRTTSERILDKLLTLESEWIEFTGGTPELNPNLTTFIKGLSGRKKIAVRTSLTVLEDPAYSFFMDLYKEHRVKVIASLPSVFEDLTDRQRGKGVFGSSIRVLKNLNAIGYGTGELPLDLVYNPDGGYLPPEQTHLEGEYRQFLRDMYGVYFDRLITMANAPIKRFRNILRIQGGLDDYLTLLKGSFNPETLRNVMCKHLVSVDYQGFVYDCDFNLALGKRIRGYEDRPFWDIAFEDFHPEITFYDHCHACTAHKGSSCHGVLTNDECGGNVRENVKRYYSIELRDSSDLKTSCCTADSAPGYVREILPYIPDEVKMKFYGCGSPIPLVVEGLKVLDLGCGSGRDSYVLSKLVGENGFVYGIDMTEEQISVAEKYVQQQTSAFGYKSPNVKFIHDYIENTGSRFQEESLDLVISNCVINLVENKEGVLRQIYRILRSGGEFYFSDIYSDRRIPEHLKRDHVLYGECLGGALYYKDFERMARKAGFADPRIVSKRVIDITNRKIKSMVRDIAFYSITYRLWKLKELEEGCEDYGHLAVYKGGIPHSPSLFVLDASHLFERNRHVKVCGNTALILSKTRLRDYFHVEGSFTVHLGKFRNFAHPGQEEHDSSSCGRGCC